MFVNMINLYTQILVFLYVLINLGVQIQQADYVQLYSGSKQKNNTQS